MHIITALATSGIWTLIVLAKLTGEVPMSGAVDWSAFVMYGSITLLVSHEHAGSVSSPTRMRLGKLDLQTCTEIISAALTRLETMRRGTVSITSVRRSQPHESSGF